MLRRAELTSTAQFATALQSLVDTAVQRRLRRIVLVDPGFDIGVWPLESPPLLASLTTFVRLPARQVLLLGCGFDELRRTSPRLVAWRRTWAHAVQARRPEGLEDATLPTLALADQALAVRLLGREAGHGTVRVDEPEVVRWAREVDALAQRSTADFPAYTLGL